MVSGGRRCRYTRAVNTMTSIFTDERDKAQTNTKEWKQKGMDKKKRFHFHPSSGYCSTKSGFVRFVFDVSCENGLLALLSSIIAAFSLSHWPDVGDRRHKLRFRMLVVLS